jgi:hypothetical protein
LSTPTSSSTPSAAIEAPKRDIAIALIDADDIALSVQVQQEFYVQATRATGPDAVAHDIAVGLFKVQEITLSVMIGALDIRVAPRSLARLFARSCILNSASVTDIKLLAVAEAH